MLGVLALVLLLLWLLGVIGFHVSAFVIHVLLIAAVILLVIWLWDVINGRRSAL